MIWPTPEGSELVKGSQNEENCEICTFWIAKMTNVRQQIEQSIDFHSYMEYAQEYAYNMLSILEIWASVCL